MVDGEWASPMVIPDTDMADIMIHGVTVADITVVDTTVVDTTVAIMVPIGTVIATDTIKDTGMPVITGLLRINMEKWTTGDLMGTQGIPILITEVPRVLQ